MSTEVQQACVELWQVMSTTFNTTVVKKSDSFQMQTVGWFLNTMGILDKERFLQRYTTTIYKSIYIPFEIGQGTDAECWSQMRTCVHEHQHVVQAKREGFPVFAGKYLFDGDQRAKFEAEAKACGQELQYWRYGQLEKPELVCASLADYNLNSAQIAFAARVLSSYQKTIKANGTITKAGKVALSFLKNNHPHLCERRG